MGCAAVVVSQLETALCGELAPSCPLERGAKSTTRRQAATEVAAPGTRTDRYRTAQIALTANER